MVGRRSRQITSGISCYRSALSVPCCCRDGFPLLLCCVHAMLSTRMFWGSSNNTRHTLVGLCFEMLTAKILLSIRYGAQVDSKRPWRCVILDCRRTLSGRSAAAGRCSEFCNLGGCRPPGFLFAFGPAPFQPLACVNFGTLTSCGQ